MFTTGAGSAGLVKAHKSDCGQVLKAVPLKAVKERLESGKFTVGQAADYLSKRMPIKFKVDENKLIDISTEKASESTICVGSNLNFNFYNTMKYPSGTGKTLKDAFINFIDNCLSLPRKKGWKINGFLDGSYSETALISPRRWEGTRKVNTGHKLFAPKN